MGAGRTNLTKTETMALFKAPFLGPESAMDFMPEFEEPGCERQGSAVHQGDDSFD